MKITVVTVKFGRTVNTGNYNTERYDAEVTAQLEDGETREEVFGALQAMARAEVASQVVYRAEMRKVDRYLAGRPSEQSLEQAMKRIEANAVLTDSDKQIYLKEMDDMLKDRLAQKVLQTSQPKEVLY